MEQELVADDELSDAEDNMGELDGVHDIPVTFTTDNARAIVAAMNHSGWFRMCCFAHVTALAVTAANKVASVKKWKQNVTNIVGHFKHSAQHLDALMAMRKERGKSAVVPVQEGATRWLSTFLMLERFAELKDEIVTLASTKFIDVITNNLPRSQALNQEMMDVLDIYKTILEPFKVITVQSQLSHAPSLPVVARFLLPILNNKEGHVLQVTEEDGTLQREVKGRMFDKYKYYYKVPQQGLLYAGAYLDPLNFSKLGDLHASDEVVQEGMK